MVPTTARTEPSVFPIVSADYGRAATKYTDSFDSRRGLVSGTIFIDQVCAACGTSPYSKDAVRDPRPLRYSDLQSHCKDVGTKAGNGSYTLTLKTLTVVRKPYEPNIIEVSVHPYCAPIDYKVGETLIRLNPDESMQLELYPDFPASTVTTSD